MSGETRIPRDICAGNTHPWETHIPVTTVLHDNRLFSIIGKKSLSKKNSKFESGPKMGHVTFTSFDAPDVTDLVMSLLTSGW